MKPSERVATRHPTSSKPGPRIARDRYEVVASAILAAVQEASEEGVRFAALSRYVEDRSPPGFWSDASVAWYTTTVKLDLEARGVIVRVPGSRPQRIMMRRGRGDAGTA